ncbi:glutamate--tRNA ligase [Candidatus Woesearchaeota archaeon]|nr:glutamate--tRNA ligase [Candidatus Woesearchaeota archaeon]
MKDIILKHALNNAVQFNGKANPGAVIGKVLQENPKLKERIKELSKEINEIVKEVNSLSLEEQQNKLKSFNIPEKKKIKEVVTIPNLTKAKKGKVVMRFAPNPNGPMSFGHSRIAIWNYLFTKKYKGKLILRFDDTDPKNKVPMKEAYKWFEEDLNWLNIKVNKIVIQSKRLKIYYSYAEKLIKQNNAYICTCKQEEFRSLVNKRIECPCRNLSPLENIQRWKNMFSKYKEGDAVLRIKTNIMHENPAVRDWPAFRIINKSLHPLDKKSKVWPLLNFASAIDDYELKVTHILRGIDLKISDTRQKYIYDYFNWQYPETIYLGKLLFSGVKSTSEAKRLIKEKKLSGWDDPRLGTLKALRKRGFQSETIVNFIKDARINASEIHVSLEKLSHLNKEVIDKKASRYFAVINPKKIKIINAPKITAKLPLHPTKKKGFRSIKSSDEFYIQDEIKKDKVYRLMHLFNFKNNKFLSIQPDPSLNAILIHWLPVSKGLVNIEIITEDNKKIKALAEPDIKNVKEDEIIQLERNFFVRKDSKNIFYYAHK